MTADRDQHGMTEVDVTSALEHLGDDEANEQTDPQPQDDTDQG